MTEDAARIVWARGHVIPGHDPALWRYDDAGNVILFTAYGDRASEYGWELDHIVRRADGGSSTLDNLRPLHWKANVARG